MTASTTIQVIATLAMEEAKVKGTTTMQEARMAARMEAKMETKMEETTPVTPRPLPPRRLKPPTPQIPQTTAITMEGTMKAKPR